MIRIGLLGASKISISAIIAPANDLEQFDVLGVAARDASRAQNFADKHSIPIVASSYLDLVNHKEIDLVYNALPPSEHAYWTVAAVRAGKHVLCEKPFAMNSDEARDMVTAANECDRCLLEAFHYRFHPLFHRLLEIVHGNFIGGITRIEAHFNVPINYAQGELRYTPQLGGGAMMDLGCYPVHWVRTLFNTEPKVISSNARWHSTGVDLAMSTELSFGQGRSAKVECSMCEQLTPGIDAEISIFAREGHIKIINPLVPNEGHTLVIQQGDCERTETVSGDSTYLHQLRHVANVLKELDAPLTGGKDAIANMEVIEEAYRLARLGSY